MHCARGLGHALAFPKPLAFLQSKICDLNNVFFSFQAHRVYMLSPFQLEVILTFLDIYTFFIQNYKTFCFLHIEVSYVFRMEEVVFAICITKVMYLNRVTYNSQWIGMMCHLFL